MKKLTIFFVVAILIFSFAASASAQDEFTISPVSSDIFNTYGSSIDFIFGKIIANSFSRLEYAQSQNITMELQVNNGSWTTIASWEKSTYDTYLRLDETYSATSGKYRIKSTHTAAGEQKVSYSQTLEVN